ncbi:hypothetical protein GCM10023186_09850 [Hymenobacter koreensis]|uniref:Uncharacterized protein n=1 Tax=Hymenobacter koreensis TaxID=1084523 RepID=A0ABP8IVY7_9BACT
MRKENPGAYEAASDPNGWLHVRVKGHSPVVRMYVNEGDSPVLQAHQLRPTASDQLGFFVADNLDGSLVNLLVRGP